MKRVALIAAALLGGVAAVRRWLRRPLSPAPAAPPPPAPPPAPPARPETPSGAETVDQAAERVRAAAVAEDPGPAPDPETREEESRHTTETRFERMVDREAEERRQAADQVRDDLEEPKQQ
jgi:hypothetical protein